jgi:beta-N-acetylhexosaminidase
MIMTAHLVCEALDPELPASLSSVVIEDHLRRALGFRGVVVSDDMEMGAIVANYDAAEAALLAVRAGTDLLSVCKTPGLVRTTRDTLATAIVEGRLSRATVGAARKRRDALTKKARKLALERVEVAEIGAPHHRELASMIA